MRNSRGVKVKDIIKIVIKGTSGFCCVDEAYNDKVTITPETISYEYIPAVESEMNPKRKWSYKTDSPIFKMKYETLVSLMPGVTEATIAVGGLIDTIEYDYPTFHLSMECFWCEVVEGELKLLEAEAAKWLTKDNLYSVQWLPADITLIEKIKEQMQ